MKHQPATTFKQLAKATKEANRITKETGIYHTAIKTDDGKAWKVTDKFSSVRS